MRRPTTTALAGALAALLIGTTPAAIAEETPELGNDEVVLATLDPTGLPTEALLVSRVVSRGGPERVILDPASTTNVGYRDRRGRPQTSADGVLLEVGGQAERTVLTEALFDKPLPVALHAQYTLAGRSVDPAAVLGASGPLTLTYTVTNTTAESEWISYVDAAGVPRRTQLPVFVPLAGALVITIPTGLRLLSAPGAVPSTDEQGRTVLRYDLYLSPPAGDYQAQAQIVLHAERGATPQAVLTLAPVTDGQSPVLGFAAGLVGQSVASTEELLAGAAVLDAQTAALARGAGELAAGTAQLTAGQQRLAQSLVAGAAGADATATGAQALADGLAGLDTGLQALAGPDGLPAAAASAEQLGAAAVVLADIIGSSDDGTWAPVIAWPRGSPPELVPEDPADLPQWADALRRLAAAVQSVQFLPDGRPRDGICELDRNADGVLDHPIGDLDCVPTLVQSLRALAAAAAAAAGVAAEIPGLLREVRASGATAATASATAAASARLAAAGAADLQASLCGAAPQLPAEQCAVLEAVAADAQRSAEQAEAARAVLADAAEPLAAADLRAAGLAVGLPLLGRLLAAAAELAAAAGDGLRSGSPADPGLVEGLALLGEALRQAADAASDLAAGAQSGAAGAATLGSAAQGLTDGLAQAGSAAGALADGAAAAGAGATDLAAGAASLRAEGTARLLQSIAAGSADAALLEAYLAAGERRAADALPYGPPPGALGSVAYAYRMPATEPAAPVPVLALAALVALVALAVGGATVRRHLTR